MSSPDDQETYYYPLESGASSVQDGCEMIWNTMVDEFDTLVANQTLTDAARERSMVRSLNGRFPPDMIESHLVSDPSLSREEFLSSHDFSSDGPSFR